MRGGDLDRLLSALLVLVQEEENQIDIDISLPKVQEEENQIDVDMILPKGTQERRWVDR